LAAIRSARVVYTNNFAGKWLNDGFQWQLFRLLSRVMPRGAVLVSSTAFTSGTRKQHQRMVEQLRTTRGEAETYSRSTLYYAVSGGWEGPDDLVSAAPRGGRKQASGAAARTGPSVPDLAVLRSQDLDDACNAVWTRGAALPQTAALMLLLAARKEAMEEAGEEV
jgi:hypothetical protein